MSTSKRKMVEATEIVKIYGTFMALDCVSFDIYDGEKVVIIGPSGSGKSTLLRSINRLEVIDRGRILVDGEDIYRPGVEVTHIRRKMGLLSQKPQVLWPLRPALEEKLSILVRDEAWISLEADDAALFSGLAPKNARIEGAAHKSLRLRAFPSENLELTFNGAPYRLPPPDADGGYRIGNP